MNEQNDLVSDVLNQVRLALLEDGIIDNIKNFDVEVTANCCVQCIPMNKVEFKLDIKKLESIYDGVPILIPFYHAEVDGRSHELLMTIGTIDNVEVLIHVFNEPVK